MKDGDITNPKWLKYPHLAWHLVVLANKGRAIADDLYKKGIRPASLEDIYETAKTFVQLYESATYDEGGDKL